MIFPSSGRAGFTLIELLVVVAIVAVVGAGVAVTYGHDLVTRARRQVTVREMGGIRDAFARFYADCQPRLLAGLHAPKDSEIFPSGDFLGTFRSGDTPTTGDRTYGMVEFYERYGLWPLLQPSVSEDDTRLEDADFVVFGGFDPVTGEGWQGPYLSAGTVAAQTGDFYGESSGVVLPQPATRHEGLYRVVYYEHCNDADDLAEPVYRRLFLVCAEEPAKWQTFTVEGSGDERTGLGLLTGNRRMGERNSGDARYGYPLNLTTGALERTYDPSTGLYVVELLNLDLWRQ